MAKIRKLTYFLAVYPDETGLFWTKFADFECLVDQGKTIEEAIAHSTAFIESVIEQMAEHHQELPVPSSIWEFKKKLDPADGEALCIVPITVYPPSKTARVNLTGKEEVFAKIDDYAKKHHVTRSELMINSTLEYIRANGLISGKRESS